MNFRAQLEDLGLNPENSIVIGSGILNALNIRESKDVDLVVDEDTYKRLAQEVLNDDLFEISTSWVVMGKSWTLEDLLEKSVVIEGVRYNTIEFLLGAKKSWIANSEARQKDIDDVKLIENYLHS